MEGTLERQSGPGALSRCKREAFAEDFRASFHAVNLSAVPLTLVESELFGHRRGSFTGAVADRAGWLGGR